MIEKEVEVLFQRLHAKICCVKKDLGDLLPEDVKDALNNSLNPSSTNVFLTEENLNNYLSQDILDALQAATTPTLANPYATMLDLMGIEPGTLITVVANYSALPPPATVTGKFYWAEAAQGTSWLPGNLGGTYYPLGIYYSNGVSWTHIQTPYQATQAEVNTGTNNDKFVTPETLKMSTQWDGVVLLAGRSGGQTINGGTGVGENLTLVSTSNATKGAIIFGDSRYNEATNRLILGTATGTGRINLPDAGTTAADGINFGTGASVFRGNASNALFYESTNAHYFRIGGNNVAVAFSTDFQIQRAFIVQSPNISGSSSTPAVSITQLWNTTGNPNAILLNVTNTASGLNSNLMDLRLDNSSQFNIGRYGAVTAQGMFQTHGVQGFRFFNQGAFTSPSDGVFLFRNAALNNFDRLQFGGTTNLFPSLKRNGDELQIRLGDDSGFGGFQAAIIKTGAGVFSSNTLYVSNGGGVHLGYGGGGGNLNLYPNQGTTPLARLNTTGQFDFLPTSLTGSQATSALNIAQTWNTTGNPTLIFANVTNTASGVSANLMDLQVGGASRFLISKGGGVSLQELSVLNEGKILSSNSNYSGLQLCALGTSGGSNVRITQTLGTVAANPRAIFQIVSTTKGVIFPCMTTAQRDAIAVISTDESLTIFNTTTKKLEVWDGTVWQQAW